MSAFEFLAAGGIVAAIIAVIHIATTKAQVGNPLIAAALAGFFGAYSAVTIFKEGVLPVWINHTTNMWGVQVWWDLLFAVGIAAFFIVPRARAQNMAVVPWLLFVAATASIGLLAMVARLFWLEKRAQES